MEESKENHLGETIEVDLSKKEKRKKLLTIGIILLGIVLFFFLAKQISPNALKSLGLTLPLPIFTIIIALIDGFNPCGLFILTLLLTLLISASHSRKRIYAVGFTFIFVIFAIYFLFMAAWLNLFKYFGFIDPLRYIIAAIAIITGLINAKEFFWFRKGFTLMVTEKNKSLVRRKIELMKDKIKYGSLPALLFASVALALFTSLIQVPCTMGFPIVFTGVLTGSYSSYSLISYIYLLFYNLVYVLPLIIITVFLGYTLQEKQISKKQMSIIKLIGGLALIALGIILLVNPMLLMG